MQRVSDETTQRDDDLLRPELQHPPAVLGTPIEEGVHRVVHGDTLVVGPLEVFDQPMLSAVDELVSEWPDGPVVIDLNHCVLTSTPVLVGLDPARWGRTDAEVCLVCSRLSGRQLLARAGATARMALFQRTEDALQAKRFFDSGYGFGWSGPR